MQGAFILGIILRGHLFLFCFFFYPSNLCWTSLSPLSISFFALQVLFNSTPSLLSVSYPSFVHAFVFFDHKHLQKFVGDSWVDKICQNDGQVDEQWQTDQYPIFVNVNFTQPVTQTDGQNVIFRWGGWCFCIIISSFLPNVDVLTITSYRHTTYSVCMDKNWSRE